MVVALGTLGRQVIDAVDGVEQFVVTIQNLSPLSIAHEVLGIGEPTVAERARNCLALVSTSSDWRRSVWPKLMEINRVVRTGPLASCYTGLVNIEPNLGVRSGLGPAAPKLEANQQSPAQKEPSDRLQIGDTQQDFVPFNLQKVLQEQGKPYYDGQKDAVSREAYYKGVDLGGDPKTLFEQMHQLVQRTHRERLAFKPEKYLHPWVDLRPNLRLQSIYSPVAVTTDAPTHVTKPQDFVQKLRVKVRGYERADGTHGPDRWAEKKFDLRSEAAQWGKILVEGGTNALEVAQKIALVEGYKFYNAEHSVPQHVFDREKDAKGDLHHLFTCERNANSIRQHFRYAEVPQTPENQKGEGWVVKGVEEFEPQAGKGAVARATLYFLLRYPGKLGDKEGEYTAADVKTLLRWHKEDPVDLYELHRNQAIEEIQGNRNPLIDFPDLAEKIDFTQGLGELGRSILE